MSEVSTSRRDVMRALSIIPVIAAPAIASAAIAAPQAGPSPEMAQAIAAYWKAIDTANEWHTRVYSPAWKACQAAVAAIPHLTTEQGFETYAGFKVTHLSTDKVVDVALARMFSKLPAHKRHGDDHDRACAELLEKLDWRAAEEVRIHAQYNMDALDAEEDRLNDVSYRAMRAVEEFPAATIHDLIAKVQFAEETDGRFEPDDLLPDLHRIAGRAVA